MLLQQYPVIKRNPEHNSPKDIMYESQYCLKIKPITITAISNNSINRVLFRYTLVSVSSKVLLSVSTGAISHMIIPNTIVNIADKRE